MVFLDNYNSFTSYYLLPLVNGASACLLSCALALSAFTLKHDYCSKLSLFSLIVSSLLVGSNAGLWYIRRRYHSLHLQRYFIPWILACVLVILVPIGCFVYSIYGFVIVMRDVVLEDEVDLMNTLCDETVITAPVWISISMSICIMFTFVPLGLSILFSRLLFMKPDTWWSDYKPFIDRIRWLRTDLGDVIPTLLIPHSNPRFTIIYSHGNASELGIMIQSLRHLSKHLKCHVVIYDYPGYGIGASTGYLSENSIYASIETVYRECLKVNDNVWGVDLSEEIILYGRSLGTAVSVHLAALLGSTETFLETQGRLQGQRGSRSAPRQSRTLANMESPIKLPRYIGGRPVERPERLLGVLQDNPLASALRTKFWMDTSSRFDMFCSIDKIHRVRVPVRICHGSEDTVVPVAHAKALYNSLQEPKYKFQVLEGKGHNDFPRFWMYEAEKAKEANVRAELRAKNEETKAFLADLLLFFEFVEENSVFHPNNQDNDEEHSSLNGDNDVQDVEDDDGLLSLPPEATTTIGEDSIDHDEEKQIDLPQGKYLSPVKVQVTGKYNDVTITQDSTEHDVV